MVEHYGAAYYMVFRCRVAPVLYGIIGLIDL